VRKQLVLSLFNAIARRYDLLNHLLSGGVDHYWRRKAVAELRALRPSRILDIATGTGDLAIAAASLDGAEIVGVDIAEEMLARGRMKLQKKRMGGRIHLQSGDAEELPFPAQWFDAATVAFGVRNFENLERGLREMHRVVRPGGMVVILEFSRPGRFPFKQIYFFYFLKVLPLIGGRISHNREAYTYLPASVLLFPEGDEFMALLKASGFEAVTQKRMTFGIATLYTGRRSSA